MSLSDRKCLPEQKMQDSEVRNCRPRGYCPRNHWLGNCLQMQKNSVSLSVPAWCHSPASGRKILLRPPCLVSTLQGLRSEGCGRSHNRPLVLRMPLPLCRRVCCKSLLLHFQGHRTAPGNRVPAVRASICGHVSFLPASFLLPGCPFPC